MFCAAWISKTNALPMDRWKNGPKDENIPFYSEQFCAFRDLRPKLAVILDKVSGPEQSRRWDKDALVSNGDKKLAETLRVFGSFQLLLGSLTVWV
jgi:hypothetical protein